MRIRSRLLTAILALLGLTCVLFYKPVERELNTVLLLRAQRPNEDCFADLVRGRDPTDFLHKCWATGKVAHRQLVAEFLKDEAGRKRPWFSQARDLLLEGTVDPDLSVRELALASLGLSGDPALFPCAQAQLSDPDPGVRMLGVQFLKKTEAHRAIPVLVPLLDDPDLMVVARTETTLMQWTGQDFGVRVKLALAAQGDPPEAATADIGQIRKGVQRRKEWWQAHSGEFPHPMRVQAALPRPGPPLADFTLADLNGKPVRLTDFSGRIVVLNFWATWCTACLPEIPDLVSLQKKHGANLAVVGIALDGVPDDHGHRHGATASEAEPAAPESSVLRQRVQSAARTRGINYTVLLDPENSVGARFNGGELPTTLIIGSDGRLLRRFIGPRKLEVFEAMIAQASQPGNR